MIAEIWCNANFQEQTQDSVLPLALFIAPTKELGTQIFKFLQKFMENLPFLQILSMFEQVSGEQETWKDVRILRFFSDSEISRKCASNYAFTKDTWIWLFWKNLSGHSPFGSLDARSSPGNAQISTQFLFLPSPSRSGRGWSTALLRIREGNEVFIFLFSFERKMHF